MKLSVEFDMSEFRSLRDQTIRLLGSSMREVVHDGVIAGVQHVRQFHVHRIRTGTLMGENFYGEIVSSNEKGTVGQIVNKTPYARYVNDGTKPHLIRPKEGFGSIGPLQAGQTRRARTDIGTHRKALRFIVGGRTVFASVVHHPGSAPFAFMQPAANAAAEFIIDRMQNVVFVQAAALWES